MVRCDSCLTEAAEGSRFCPTCARRLPVDPSGATAIQILDEDTPPPTSEPPTEFPNESRFLPGTVLANRFRIVGLIGRGGMGEVYRADDLKLGQTVALKFLHEGLRQDPSRVDRFLGEIRLARQVTHPNVCRVYDAGEVAGQHFISMEYIDGEDLASLLRRIGRLPGEKALQIARQLCAGLSEAHAQKILHRDLKPANVMLDGRGRATITDFGLAGLIDTAAGQKSRGGTPSYMAPEQLEGKPVTIRSDVYALGLVLYELFTGHKPYQARSSEELRSMQGTTPSSPSSFVSDLDPTVERAVMRCLEPDPQNRPTSAMALAAALPGGDPLAESIAAGETPSPEMVADAGGRGGMSPGRALLCLAGALLGLALTAATHQRIMLYGHVDLSTPPEALAVKAQEILRESGYTEAAVDRAWGFRGEMDYFRHVENSDRSPGRWEQLGDVRPSPVSFWYRQSPQHLVPRDFFKSKMSVTLDDPPPLLAGMASVRLDPDGRLQELLAIPEEHDSFSGDASDLDWSVLFQRAGLEFSSLERSPPQWNPPVGHDQRLAWTGVYVDRPESPIRVEAAVYQGKPVYFSIIPAWMSSTSPQSGAGLTPDSIGDLLLIGLVLAVLCGGSLLALRNLRLGRGDRQGAFRFAVFLFVAQMMWWVLVADHVPNIGEASMLFQQLSWSVFMAGAVWVFYIGVEPHIRRLSPDLIIAWTRLLDGRYRDPLVGRAILVGGVGFGALHLIMVLRVMAHTWLGRPAARPLFDLDALQGVRQAAAIYFDRATSALWFPVAILCLLLLLRVLVRRQTAAVILFCLLAATITSLQGSSPPIEFAAGLAFWGLQTFLLTRFGMLSLVMTWVFSTANHLPLTTDLTSWYAGRSVFGLCLLAALACYGFYLSLAGRSLLPGELMNEPRTSSGSLSR